MAIVKPFRALPPIVRKEYNPDFVDYVWYKSLFNDAEIKQINSLWDDQQEKMLK